MKRTAVGLVLLACGALSACAGTFAMDGLSMAERAGVVRADSGCDDPAAGGYSDPSSHCYVARRGGEEAGHH